MVVADQLIGKDGFDGVFQIVAGDFVRVLPVVVDASPVEQCPFLSVNLDVRSAHGIVSLGGLLCRVEEIRKGQVFLLGQRLHVFR